MKYVNSNMEYNQIAYQIMYNMALSDIYIYISQANGHLISIIRYIFYKYIL